jgi:hypothetical protein
MKRCGIFDSHDLRALGVALGGAVFPDERRAKSFRSGAAVPPPLGLRPRARARSGRVPLQALMAPVHAQRDRSRSPGPALAVVSESFRMISVGRDLCSTPALRPDRMFTTGERGSALQIPARRAIEIIDKIGLSILAPRIELLDQIARYCEKGREPGNELASAARG